MPAPAPPRIDALFVGEPKTMIDLRGTWTSSIQRERTSQHVRVSLQGIVGDKATQPYHGGPNAALCVHVSDHYDFWRREYGVELQPGAVGENLTLSGLTEEAVYAGGIVRFGSVLAQVSGPRVPCANQARHIDRPDWVRLTVRENRTGFYMRVLEPGTLRVGDLWQLERRLNEDASITRINRCMYLDFDPVYAERMMGMSGLGAWWSQQAGERMAARDKHWTRPLCRTMNACRRTGSVARASCCRNAWAAPTSLRWTVGGSLDRGDVGLRWPRLRVET